MTFISDVKSLSNAKLRKAPRLSTRFNRSQIPRKTTAQQLTRPGLPPPPRMVQPNRMSFRLSQNVKPQSISNGNGNSEIESSHTIPPIHSATSPASTVAIPMQRPYPRQQPQPTQQAAPRQAVPNSPPQTTKQSRACVRNIAWNGNCLPRPKNHPNSSTTCGFSFILQSLK